MLVWIGTDVTNAPKKDVEQCLQQALKARQPLKYVGTVTTLPGNGGSGGRTDVFLLVHRSDIPRVAVNRLRLGDVRWWEDIFYNIQQHIYPRDIIESYPPAW